MNAVDKTWTMEVARDWKKHEGVVDKWKCPTCKTVWESTMVKGVRQVPAPVRVYNERELPTSSPTDESTKDETPILASRVSAALMAGCGVTVF